MNSDLIDSAIGSTDYLSICANNKYIGADTLILIHLLILILVCTSSDLLNKLSYY